MRWEIVLDLFEYKVIVGTESCHEAKLWRSKNKKHPAQDGMYPKRFSPGSRNK
jgi:hypothetical protein